MMPNFSKRSQQPELMDTQDVSYEEFYNCLRDLEWINRWTLAYRPTLDWLANHAMQAHSNQPLSLLDVGCGGGDMLRQIRRWADKRQIAIRLTGIDLNPYSRKTAMTLTPESMDISYIEGNLFDYQPDQPIDFIISSLFTHHLNDAQLQEFIDWMQRTARIGWFVNDLHRHWLPWLFIKYAVWLLQLNRLVQHDAPVSVARAFVKDDWQQLLAPYPASSQVQIKWYFPFRYGIGGVRHD